MIARTDNCPFLFILLNMLNNKKVCVFVDGENLRHSIGDLFPLFDKRTYLPKTNWTKFFDLIAQEAAGADAERVRTYWYVVQNIDFSPFNLNSARKDANLLKGILSKNKEMSRIIATTAGGELSKLMEKKADELQHNQNIMEKRFSGWTSLQDSIARNDIAIEFRRAGSIRCDLFDRKLGFEKAVDVKLATDLIKLKDIYDVAVIVSGDQDYVPAVDTIKDFGKRTVNVAFQTEKGHLLPGGAKRLNNQPIIV